MFNATVLAFTTDLATLFDPRTVATRPVLLGVDLSASRLAAFNEALFEAAPGAGAADAEAIARAARSVLAEGRDGAHPFVRERMALVPEVLAMMADEDWCLGDRPRRQVRALGQYVRNPDDLIPDDLPLIGLLDDAILVDRCVGDLQHELADWRDFRDFRRDWAAAQGIAVVDCHPSRLEWLAARRHAATQARRAAQRGHGEYASSALPGRFRVG
jgi:hypothetical protein